MEIWNSDIVKSRMSPLYTIKSNKIKPQQSICQKSNNGKSRKVVSPQKALGKNTEARTNKTNYINY